MNQPTVQLPDLHRRIVVGALLTGTFLSSLEIMVVSPAVPVLVDELNGAGLYPWVFSSYVITQTAMMPIYGRLADHWGRRSSYGLSALLFTLGSWVCAIAPDMHWLIAGRVLQGLGSGGLVPLTMTIFGDIYAVADRTRMQAVFSLVWGISSLLGPLIGGLLTEHWSWRGAFWINLPPAAFAVLAISLFLPAMPTRAERQKSSFLTDLTTLLRLPTQRAIGGAGIALGAALMGIIGYLPMQIQIIDGGSPSDAALAIIPMSVAWTAAAFLAGRLVQTWGFRRLVRVGSLIAMFGTAWAAWSTGAQVGLTLFGLGMGLTISCFNVAAQESAPLALRGQATSLALLARSLGRAGGVIAFAAVAGIPPGIEELDAVPELDLGLRRVFQSIAACTGVGAFILWRTFPSQDFESDRPT